ncbi:glycosyltransferase [Actinacidiphila acidipaludis]|uniref:4,4'-diaponeurosporenoate glycosyltransferase n=1 Tax=Actinacidiphila acidipaludis TaxID=2873382 RepID=A0ABS7QBG4_9ACTN|nr:glycosyltransferase family 2 protein [Streptomyces acidipaludis]MBY8880039.1 glycosyltransferase [Streptomyces acidipaludis]
MTSIVIPAHNEERVIGRLLDALSAGSGLDIVVVCNGCTDGTARAAAARPGVRVVEIPTPSKHLALRTGDAHAVGFPRLYVDADVVIGSADVRVLAGAVGDGPGEVLAAAPGRDLPLAGCAWPVRAYYRIWQRLPAVRDGLFGRGVIALSEEGHARIASLPPLMADDLAASLAFAPHERRVVDGARVTVLPPRTWADLIRRRVRAGTSTAQLEQHQAQSAAAPAGRATAAAESGRAPAPGGDPAPEAPGSGRPAPSPGAGGSHQPPQPPPSARTSPADLRLLLRREPWLLPHLVVFLGVALVARRKSERAVRQGDFGTWLRDESSRRD